MHALAELTEYQPDQHAAHTDDDDPPALPASDAEESSEDDAAAPAPMPASAPTSSPTVTGRSISSFAVDATGGGGAHVVEAEDYL